MFYSHQPAFTMTPIFKLPRKLHRGSARDYRGPDDGGGFLARGALPPQYAAAVCESQKENEDKCGGTKSAQQCEPLVNKRHLRAPQTPAAEKMARAGPPESDPESNKQQNKINKSSSKNRILTSQSQSRTPEAVLRDTKRCLTLYEQNEIKEYSHVWYVGEKAKKSRRSKEAMSAEGECFDDSKGFYKVRVGDHLAYRFEVLGVMGSGLAGNVLKCRDHKTMVLLAIKVFRNTTEGHKLAQTELDNLKTLQRLDKTNKANMVHMKEHFYFRNHLCITFELFEKDLHKALVESKLQRLCEADIRKYAIDVLKCLKVLKDMQLIHGDLKPENILLDKENNAAVSDFGGSIFIRGRPTNQTLAYMAPERLVGKCCTTASDMWSLGCTLAELDWGLFLFKGKDKAAIFNCITRVLGLPPVDLQAAASKKNYCMESVDEQDKKQPKNPLAMRLKSKNPKFLDFIRCCLEYDAAKRLTPEKALRHPWIKQATKHTYNKPTISSLLKREKIPPPMLQPTTLHK
ncbi:dual specificity tyrosine-phosphorylation-regulated kinase 4-like isoform X2 [Entelurus aequoreus]|uniref:dual specificity tyrosine-phosphorylation-regulated kinase 4-like isoform X2 n=1 Tax=Entelurus aequoreus TaxID=161455 RepID=UPI002B1E7848|nr:dual specificity tyrosine-phosphorylation-regulated kinase 4-like isoform X2 [Entelurus aequoreus]XP_061893568.1 dual specificity tyrosine-phosphorylation-regulated kinase 4-like isoform X2 [Entelurus aequoreus]